MESEFTKNAVSTETKEELSTKKNLLVTVHRNFVQLHIRMVAFIRILFVNSETNRTESHIDGFG